MLLFKSAMLCFVKNVNQHLSAPPFVKSILVILAVFLHTSVWTQPCTTPISNDSIQIKQATCEGTVATLVGTKPTGGNGSYTYQWQKSVGNCNTGVFESIPSATFRDYAVPASTSPNDCFRRIVVSGSCSSISNTVRVLNTDRSTPVAPLTTAVASSCITAMGSITVTSPAPDGVLEYSIDGLNYSTSNVFPSLYPKTYTVTVRYPAGCISPPRTQIVSALPPVSGSITTLSSTICVGDSTLLTASGGTSYQWYKNNFPLPFASGNTFYAKEAGTYTADIIVGQCTVKASNAITVTVNPLPTGSILPTPVTICAGSSATLTATGGTTYQWYKNNNSITGATNATYSVTEPGIYTADIINSFGCRAKASNASEVTVVPLPSGTITPSSGVLCGNNPVVLTASGGTSYQWYKDNSPLTATGNSFTATTPGIYTVDIISAGCTSKAANAVVVTQAAASVSISPASVTICPGTSQLLTATAGTGTYQWFRDNQPIPGATNAVFSATEAGAYRVELINGSCTTRSSNTVPVTQSSTPTGTISPAASVLCPGSSIVLTATSTGSGFTFQWLKDGVEIPGATSATFTATQKGSYQVKFASGSCIGTSQNSAVITESTPISFTTNTTHLSCSSATGNITVTGVTGGGSAAYQYSSNNGASYQPSNSFSGLTAGTYQVVVRDAAGCVSSPTPVTIQLTGKPANLVVNNPPRICPDETANLQASAVTAGSDTGLIYTYWRDTAATQPLNNPAAVAAGKYFIKAANQFGCVSIKPVVVLSHAAVPGSISPAAPPTACFDIPVTLMASNGSSYQWYRNDTLLVNATGSTYKATIAGEYSVLIGNGSCQIPAANKVMVRFQACVPDAKVFVPTAFTPNRNGANDVLRPVFYNVVQLNYFRVYNRWGQLVFQTSDAGKGWDGTLKGVTQPSDTYAWVLEGIGKNGDVIKLSGRSLLIR